MRRPPILGIVGVDFGRKPAISLVVLRRKRPSILDEDVNVCVCDPALLASLYEVVVFGEDFPGIVDVEIITTGEGDTCEAIGFAGSNDLGTLAFIDFLSPEATKWQLGLDNGSITPTLYKIAGSGTEPSCDIASPVGFYEGDGYTATVSAI
jgi:hypothetical protein